MKRALYLAVLMPSFGFCAGAGGINVTPDPKAILRSTNTWTGAQTFIGSITVTSCSGCGSGGSSSGYPDWMIDGSFIGPNAPGANPIKYKWLEVNGNMRILNSYTTFE